MPTFGGSDSYLINGLIVKSIHISTTPPVATAAGKQTLGKLAKISKYPQPTLTNCFLFHKALQYTYESLSPS